MATCPECGETVKDNVCTSCGTSVWPQGESDDPTGAPAPPTATGASAPPTDTVAPAASTDGDGTGQAPGATGFVNPPEPAPPPPPPPSGAPPPPPPPGADADRQPTDGSSGSSKRILWWVLGGLAVLAVIGVLAVLLVVRGSGLSADDIGRVGEGSPERLAELRSSCDAGDMQACDDLYLESPFDSEDEAFGDTCGGRNEPAGWCVDVHGETAPPK